MNAIVSQAKSFATAVHDLKHARSPSEAQIGRSVLRSAALALGEAVSGSGRTIDAFDNSQLVRALGSQTQSNASQLAGQYSHDEAFGSAVRYALSALSSLKTTPI